MAFARQFMDSREHVMPEGGETEKQPARRAHNRDAPEFHASPAEIQSAHMSEV
jgi:hypothetical protein